MIIEHIKSMLLTSKERQNDDPKTQKPIRQLKKQRSQERLRRQMSTSTDIISTKLHSKKKFHQILPDRLSILLQGGCPRMGKGIKLFTIKDWFYYPDLTEYYGPSNIAHVVRFNQLLQEHFTTTTSTSTSTSTSIKELCLLLDPTDKQSLNGLLLVAAFLLIEIKMEISEVEILIHDAYQQVVTKTFKTEGSYATDDLPISVRDCLIGISIFTSHNLLPPIDTLCPQTIMEMERVENGDMNWIIPGKILAFAGPRPDYFSVDKFIDWAIQNGVRGIVRLNKGGYKAKDMKERGLDHYQMFIPDGHVPTMRDIDRFITIADNHLERGEAIGVHCHAGLGRTATMIALFLIKKYSFSADYVIAFLRMMRPGSVLSYQARFLECMQYSIRGEETPVECKEWLDLLDLDK